MTSVLRGRVVTPENVIEDGVVAIEGATITEVSTADQWSLSDLPEPQGTLLPGLVDIHCHGGGGATFTTTNPSEAIEAAAHHHRHGTTSVMASLVTASADDLVTQVRTLAPLVRDGSIAGVHLEGPFLSAARCGAQDPALIVDPDPETAARIIDAADGAVSMMTIAPERPGYEQAAKVLRGRGVAVALGHSDADYDTFATALADLDGSGIVTHLANGMPPFHHRAGGPVGASFVAASATSAFLELIADGQHVDAGFVRLAFAVGHGRIALVTDAMAAAGMADGEYDLGGQQVGVREGLARLVNGDGEFGSIAGGTSHLIENVARCVGACDVSLLEAVRAASIVPARAVGIDDTCGALLPGRYADVVVTDERLSPTRVMRRGAWL
ncbi:MAG: N-acetylglucosamine-6-phosphate deacetylase [Actinomycetia bacterium]|nr:N-acetylglucosamine-6-phosphate deacetylase [Actinomycetes bacterium]